MKIVNTLKSLAQRLPKRQTGQGMTEYIIIVALIAVAAIGVYSLFGQTIRSQVSGLANEVAGTGKSADDIKAAKDAASKASSQATQTKGMGSYGN